MAGLAEFRKQYPQYNDIPDQQLADSLHQKFYSDLPKDQYYQSLGLETGETLRSDATPEELTEAGRPARAIRLNGGRTVAMVRDVDQGRDNWDRDTQGERTAAWTGDGGVLEAAPAMGVAGTRSAVANIRRMAGEESAAQRREALGIRVPSQQDVAHAEFEGAETPLPSHEFDPMKSGENAGGAVTGMVRRSAIDRQRGALQRDEAAVKAAERDVNVAQMDLLSVTPADMNTAQQAVTSLAQSAAPTMLGVAAGILTRNPALAMAIAGGGGSAIQAGSTYGEAREKGASHRLSALAATIDGILEGVGEALPLGIALKQGSPIANRIFGTIVAEAGQEAATEAMQSFNAFLTYNPKITLQEAWQNIKVATLSGGMGGAVYGAAGAAADAGRQRAMIRDDVATDLKTGSDLTPEAPAQPDVAAPAPTGAARPSAAAPGATTTIQPEDPETAEAELVDESEMTAMQLAMKRAKERAAGTRTDPVEAATSDDVDAAGAQVNTEPSEAQKTAGNYAKGHLKLQGLDVTIESPKDSTRSGEDAEGSPWEVVMPAAYGYVKRTNGADGDQVDVYIGPDPKSRQVFIVDQIDPKTGKFDEHKVLIGFSDESDARGMYEQAFSDNTGADRMGAVTPMQMGQFKAWLKKGDTTKPYAYKFRSPHIAALQDESIRTTVTSMRDAIGAQERGGKLIVDEVGRDSAPGTGDVMGRTSWIGEKWWFSRPDQSLSADQARRAIDKAIAGERLGGRELRFVEYVAKIAQDVEAQFAEAQREAQAEPEYDDLSSAGQDALESLIADGIKVLGDERVTTLRDWIKANTKNEAEYEELLRDALETEIAESRDGEQGEQTANGGTSESADRGQPGSRAPPESAGGVDGQSDPAPEVAAEQGETPEVSSRSEGAHRADAPPTGQPPDGTAPPAETVTDKTPSKEGVSTSDDSQARAIVTAMRDAMLSLIDAKEAVNVVGTIRDDVERTASAEQAQADLEKAEVSMRKAYGNDEATPMLEMSVAELYDMYEALAGGRRKEKAVASERNELELTGETPADLAAKAQQESAAAMKEAALAMRDAADAMREQFTLSGSDRAADVGAASGQQDLLGQSENIAPADKRKVSEVEESANKKREAEQPVQAYNPDQLDLIYDNAETRPGTTDQQRALGVAALKSLFGRDRRAGASLLGSALWKDFAERKGADLIGQQAGSAEDLAYAAQILRDPRFETFRFFFTKDGKIVGHTGVTSRLPGIVSFGTDVEFMARAGALRNQMQSLGADGYWMLHNHPSGTSGPSRADIAMTQEMDRLLGGFRGHVIVDHDEYSAIERRGLDTTAWSTKKLPATKMPEPELPHDALGKTIDGGQSFAAVAKTLQVKEGFATVIATSATGKINAIAEIPEALLTDKSKMGALRATVRLRRFFNGTGSALGVFVVSGDPSAYTHLVEAGALTDAVSPRFDTSLRAGGVTPAGGDIRTRNGRRAQVLRAEQMQWPEAMFSRQEPLDIGQLNAELSLKHTAVQLVLTEKADAIGLEGIKVPDSAKRNAGRAGAAMRDLVRAADRHRKGVILMAYPDPEDKHSLPLEDLVKWYQKFGFEALPEQEFRDAVVMYREPKEQANAISDPAHQAGGAEESEGPDGRRVPRAGQAEGQDPGQVKGFRSPIGPATAGLSVSAIEKALRPVIERWANAPDVIILPSIAQAPASIREQDAAQRSQGDGGAAEGVFWNGSVYLFADKINSTFRAQTVLFHEVLGHHGLHGAFGDALNPILDQLANTRAGQVLRKAREYGLDIENPAHRRYAAEELLAEMAQTHPKSTWVQRAIAAIKRFLRDLGLNVPTSDSDIVADYILPARAFVERGGQTDFGAEPAMASRKPSINSLLRQHGEEVLSIMDAERRFNAGDRIFIGHEMETEAPFEISSVTELKGYTSDQMIALPREVAFSRGGSTRKRSFKNLTIDEAETLSTPELRQAVEYFQNTADTDARGAGFKSDGQIMLDALEEMLDDRGEMESSTDQTQTKAFKDWFGESKVVDADGKPLVVYHGTRSDFSEFDFERAVMGVHFFSANPKHASAFSGHIDQYSEEHGETPNVMPVYLSMQNPTIIQGKWLGKNGNWNFDELYIAIKRAKQAGADGLIIKDFKDFNAGRGDTYIAFEPTQIKSAVGNSGQFDPGNPDIRFSRAQKTEATKDASADLKQPHVESIGDYVGDIGAFKKLAVYPRTIASLEPDFTPVYRAAESQFETRDRYAAELGRMAEKYFDLTQEERGRVDAVLELGRLKGEALAGKQMSMENTGQNTKLSEKGDVLTLTDAEKSAYWAARKMLDKALTMYRDQAMRDFGVPVDKLGRDYRQKMVDMAKEADPQQKAYLEAAIAIYDEIEAVRKSGYIPFSRWGDVVIVVRDRTGATLWAEKVETGVIERNVPGRKNIEAIPSVSRALGAVRSRFRNEQVEIKAFNVPDRIPLEGNLRMADLDMLAELARVDNQQWESIRDQLAKGLQAKGFRKHLMGSSNVPGYSTDFERAISDYIIGLSGYLSRRMHADQWESSIASIDKRKPNLIEYAKNYQKYVNDPQEEWNRLRQAGFLYYIAGVPASAFVNLTQVQLLSAPYMTQFIGAPRVQMELTRAYKDVSMMGSVSRGFDLFDPTRAPADVREDLQSAWDEGFFVPLETYELMGKAYNRTPTQRRLQKGIDDGISAVSILFQGAERVNRLVTFIAAHRIGRIPGVESRVDKVLHGNPLAREELGSFSPRRFAEWVIDETHFRMGKINRPGAMRGVGTAILQFRGFTLQTLELWTRMMIQNGPEGKAMAAYSLLLMFAVAGVWGMPGADDLRNLLERFYKAVVGEDMDLKTKLRELVTRITGSPMLSQMFSKGVTYPAGLDLSGRIGMGNIAPDSAMQVFGIPADLLAGRPMRALEAASRGHWQLAMAELLPNFIKNPMQAADWAESGVRSQATGKVAISADEVTAGDVAQKSIGFTPARISNIREANWAEKRASRAVDDLRNDYYAKLGSTIAAKVRAERAGDVDKAARLDADIKATYQEISERNRGKAYHEMVVIRADTLRTRVRDELTGTTKSQKARRQARSRTQEIREAYGLTQ
jgi:hypothetical protein